MKKSFSLFSKYLTFTVFWIFSSAIFADHDLRIPIPSPNDIIQTFGIPSQSSLPKRINILVWNLHKGLNEAFSSDFMSLARQKDLVLAQEICLNPLMRFVFSSFPNYFYTSGTSFFYGKDLSRTGVATAGPVEASNIDYIRTGTLEPVLHTPKLTLITRYPIKFTTKQLTVVNIHGINFVDDASYNIEINRIYEVLKDIAGPLIFAGDFNSWNSNRMNILKKMSLDLKLNEASFFPDFRKKFDNYPLDHFYHTDDIKIISAKVEGFYQGSDHAPLEVIAEYLPQVKSRKKH